MNQSTGLSRSHRSLLPYRMATAGCIAVWLLAMTACARVPADQAQVVRDYVKALVPALQAESLQPLSQVATADEVERVKLDVMDRLYKRNQRMSVRLAEFEVVSAEEISANETEIHTREAWTIRYKDRESGRSLKSQDFEQDVSYTLVRTGGRWLISRVAVE